MTEEICDCGKPLHYTDREVETLVRDLVARHGDTVEVRVQGSRDTYRVPRHYMALHGLTAAQVPEVAARYGWEKVQ